MNYYNEIDPYAAQWLRNLIAERLIPDGEVDERSIADVKPGDLKGFIQCHFFAGIGGWPCAFRLAGWPDDRPVWSGSCPCQPYSAAGAQKGFEDERDLWPIWFNLIAEVEPAVVFGEQVSAAIGQHWLDRVRVDLERSGYALGAAVLPACAVDAPHKRDRLWFVAHPDRGDGQRGSGEGRNLRPPKSGEGPDHDADGPSADSSGLVADAAFERFNGTRQAGQTGRNEFANGGDDVADADEPGAREKRLQRGGQFGGAGSDQEDRLGTLADTQRGECDGRANQPKRGAEGREIVGRLGEGNGSGNAADTRSQTRLFGRQDPRRETEQRHLRRDGATHWSDAEWVIGADGKARRVKSSIRMLAYGVPARVGKLRAFGNAIVPQVAAQVIGAYMDLAA